MPDSAPPPRPSAAGLALAATVGLAVAALVFVWFEAAVEVEILCDMIDRGDREVDVRSMLDTGTFLRVDDTSGGWTVRTPWTLDNGRCAVTLTDGRVVDARFEERFDVAGAAARLGATLAAALALLQAALAAGAPWGTLAWGGRHPGRLPPGLRAASLVSTALVAAGAVAILQRGGVVDPLLPPTVASALTAILAGVFGLSIVGNRLSSSPLERRVQTPVAVMLAVTFLVVALSK